MGLIIIARVLIMYVF